MSEVEETLKRINSHKGVQGIVIANSEGTPIRTTLDANYSDKMAGAILNLALKARSTVRSLDPQNDLTFLRVRSKKYEILIAPEKVRHRAPCCWRLRLRVWPPTGGHSCAASSRRRRNAHRLQRRLPPGAPSARQPHSAARCTRCDRACAAAAARAARASWPRS
jgi:dynein light chain roadblock-type